jgi:2-aminobenzoate-CoA ligase
VNAASLIERNIEKGRGNSVAVYFLDRKVTWHELVDEMNKIGNGLKGLGIEEADRVCIYTVNIPEFIMSFYAIQKIGAITVPIMFLLRSTELEYITNHCEAKVLIADNRLLGEVEKAKAQFKTIKHIIVIGGNPQELEAKGYMTYEKFIANQSNELKTAKTSWDDVSDLLYTSGTTGLPKGCAHLHGSRYAQAFSQNCAFPAGPDDVLGSSSPLSFAYGTDQLGGWLGADGAAFAIVPPGPLKPEQIAEYVVKYRITRFWSNPSTYREILRIPDLEKKYDLSKVKIAITSAEPITPEIEEQWKKKFGVPLRNWIGSSETSEFCYCWSDSVDPTSLGLPEPGYDILIIDEEGRVVPQGQEGDLVIQGHSGLLYWKDPERQAESIRNGYSFLGDKVYLDENGMIRYVSRTKFIMKVSGASVAPLEIERCLFNHPAVRDIAVIGKPDRERSEIPKAYIILKQGFTPSDALAKELQTYVRERMAPYKMPREIEFVETIPKGPTGKTVYAELQKRVMKEAKDAGII